VPPTLPYTLRQPDRTEPLAEAQAVEKKLKHLEFIQAVINRMANTSFMLKGWSITIIAGLFAFSANERAIAVLWLGVLLTLVFWYLDSYFLWQERLFRSLYDHVRTLPENQVDFDMDQMSFSKSRSFLKAVFSMTLWPFYLLAALAQAYFIRSLS
jgi:hypothetical protein